MPEEVPLVAILYGMNGHTYNTEQVVRMPFAAKDTDTGLLFVGRC